MRAYGNTRHASSMIPQAKPTVPPVAIINFQRICNILKSGDVRTDGQTRVKIMITTGRDCGSAE